MGALPSWAQACACDPAGLREMGDRALAIAKAIGDPKDSLAKTTRDTVYNLPWSGVARNAAEARADQEQSEIRALAGAYEELGLACQRAADEMTGYIEALWYKQVGAGTGWSMDIHDPTWTIKGRPSEMPAAELHEALVYLAQQLVDTSDKWARTIAAAVEDMRQMAPVTFVFNSAVIDEVVRDAKAGHLTQQDLDALHAAVRLTPQQQADLAHGKPVDLPRGQFDALTQLMRSQDGAGIGDLFRLDPSIPTGEQGTLNGEFGDAMQLISNPQVHAAGCNEVGGIQQLPTEVRTLLQEDPVKTNGQFSYFRFDDFNTMNKFLDRADKNLAQGSDLDRGLLKQTSDIATAAKQPVIPDPNAVPQPNPYASQWDRAGDLLDHTIANVRGDHQAVHDFTTGHGMDVTCTGTKHFDPKDHVPGLLGFNWGEDHHAVADMYKFVGQDAGSHDTVLSLRAEDTGRHLNTLLPEANLSPEHKLAFTNPLLLSAHREGADWMAKNMPALQPDPSTFAHPHDVDNVAKWVSVRGQELFGDHGPGAEDIQQGDLGDCWFMGSLDAAEHSDPGFLMQHVQPNDNGTVTVTLFQDGKPVPVTITPDLPSADGRHVVYAHTDGTAHHAPGSLPPYAALYEKALAVQMGGYSQIEGNHGSTGLGYITGETAPDLDPHSESIADISNRLTGHGAVVTGTVNNPSNPQLVGGHEYTVVGVDPDKGTITVRNPWGVPEHHAAHYPDQGGRSQTREYVTLTKDEWDRDFDQWTGVPKP